MDAERWRKARELFERLADLPPESWEARLAEGSDDADVRAEALALLRADSEVTAHTAVSSHAPELLDAAARDHERAQGARLVGRRLGPFKLVREIGRGGMGQVWLAQRVDGQFEQQVAIKLLRSGWDDADASSRFRAERQILASLTHPNIAHLVDGGVDDESRPWLALEYVDGSDLRAHCDVRKLDLAQRLRLFLTVCDAVSYAHARLVVHRDIKPSNVLVAGESKVKLLDFGIAKLIEHDATTSATRVFTPEYAAPEQVRGEAVTTSVDVYALGLLLYELLTGRRPYRLENTTPAAYERAILDQEPTKPSLIVTRRDEQVDADQLAQQRDLSPQRLRRELRGDLDAIVLKALRKEPTQRYSSVGEFADDVKRYLDCEPVAARRGNWRYRAARFVQRHTLAAALTLVALLSLVGGFGVALWQAREARAERDHAVAEAAKSRAALDFMGGLFQSADPEEARGTLLSARDLLTRGTERIRDALKDQPGARAELLGAMGQAHRGLGMYEESLPLLQEAANLADASGDAATQRAAELQRAESLHALARFKDELALLDALAPKGPAGAAEQRLQRADIELRRGLAAQALNDLELAATAYATAYTTRRELLGAEDWRTLEVALRQVSLLSLRGKHRDALPIAEETLASVRRSGSSSSDPHLADTINALAMVRTNLNQLPEAEALRREELAIVHRAYDADHPRVLGAENDLAAVLFTQSRLDEAATSFRRVLEGRRRKFGADNPAVATVANNLAWCEIGLGHLAQARELAADALRIRLANYGANHHTTAASMRTLGASEILLGQYAAAGEHLHAALAAYQAALGKQDAPTLNDLARLELFSGKPSANCSTARRAVAAYGAKADDDSPSASYERVILQACLLVTKAADSDYAAFQTALQTVRSKSTPGHPNITKADALAALVERSRAQVPRRQEKP